LWFNCASFQAGFFYRYSFFTSILETLALFFRTKEKKHVVKLTLCNSGSLLFKKMSKKAKNFEKNPMPQNASKKISSNTPDLASMRCFQPESLQPSATSN